MFINDFPSCLEDYFRALSDSLYVQEVTIPEPWFYQTGIRIFGRLHPDPAVKRFQQSSWYDLRTLYNLQIARSERANLEDEQHSHFQLACGKNALARNFGQLPCTVKSIKSRVKAIAGQVSKEDKILIIGDDDALSIALAEQGFTNITVFEIDIKVVEKLQQAFKKLPQLQSQVIQQDVYRPLPAEVQQCYALVAFDPWYALDGLRSFTECALKASTGNQPKIMLSFNTGALLNDYSGFLAYLKEINYAVTSWSPLLNTYPMPASLSCTLQVAELLVSALSFKKTFPVRRGKKAFFSSDLLLLAPL